MNILLIVIPFLFQSFTSNCDCDKYAPFLEHAKNTQIVVVGEVISLQEPYYLESEGPLNPDAPNRNSAVLIKVVQLVKGDLEKQEIKVFGYRYYSEQISQEQPFRLGFEYAKVGEKYLFCLQDQETAENHKKGAVYELKCCGASFLPIDQKSRVVGKIESSESISTKSLDWVLSEIK